LPTRVAVVRLSPRGRRPGVVRRLATQRALGEAVEVISVRLPWERIDPRRADLPTLVEAVDAELGPSLDQPHLFYGHSVGALIAYRLSCVRVARGLPSPVRLVVSAYPAPHLPHPLWHTENFGDEQLAELLIDLSGVPAALLADQGWLRQRMIRLRRDIGVCARQRATAGSRPLPCPIHVLTGADDPLVGVGAATEWARHTAGQHTVHVLPGGHFFPVQHKTMFFALLNKIIALPTIKVQL
jgi:surfactin synthase thioesterase subunit